jgi:protein TonB
MIQRQTLLLPLAFVVALLVTTSLFTLMQTMISGTPQENKIKNETQIIDFVRLAKPEQVETKKRVLPQRPEPSNEPELKTPEVDTTNAPMETPNIAFPQIELPIRIGGTPLVLPKASGKPSGIPSSARGISGRSIGSFSQSSEVIPLVRIQPRYPPRAARSRLAGTVVVQFKINPDGTVASPRVVKSEPPNVFDDAAIKAILRWKFKPKIVNGKAVSQYASQEFKFTPK